MKITGILKAQEIEGNDVLLDFECESNSGSQLKILVSDNQYEKFFCAFSTIKFDLDINFRRGHYQRTELYNLLS